jgi:hypothetical protein
LGGCACTHWAPFPPLLHDLQPLVLPEAAYDLAVSPPRCGLEQMIALPLAQAWRPLRERMQTRAQLYVTSLACLPPLWTAVQHHDAAGTMLAAVRRLLQIHGRLTLGGQAEQFCSRTSCNI